MKPEHHLYKHLGDLIDTWLLRGCFCHVYSVTLGLIEPRVCHVRLRDIVSVNWRPVDIFHVY